MDNLARTTLYQLAKRADTPLDRTRLSVLEYAWLFYRKNGVGPLYRNIRKHTGVGRQQIEDLFPNGIHSVYTWVGIPIQDPEKICKPMVDLALEEIREVYLDYNATTHIRPEVAEQLASYFNGVSGFGNPSSSSNRGRQAFDIVYEARLRIAQCLKVKPEEIVFTGSGTEADNTAIKGIAFQYLARGGHIISSNAEHAAVLETVKAMEGVGFDVTLLPCGGDGRVSAAQVRDALREDTILVSIMTANNEIGVLNPVAEIGAVCQAAGVPFMTAAIQAFCKTPIEPKQMGINLLTLSGHKIYAPKGVGAMYVDERLHLEPLLHGGGQESGLRSGTENVSHIQALGLAAALAYREMEAENRRLSALRDYFLARLRVIEPGFVINGSLEHRLPNNLNIGFPNVDSGSLLLSLNQIGIYVSSGSACRAGSKETSHVIRALGLDTNQYGTIRFSFGMGVDREDLDYLFTWMPEILRQLRRK